MLFVIFTLFILIHFLIGVYDFSFFRIPNLFLGMLLVLYGFYAPIYLEGNTILSALVIFAIMFALSFGLYMLKFIGAGDAKYIPVASLWVGAHGILPLLFLISLVGGGLALLYLVFRDFIGRFSDTIWLKIQAMEARYPRLQNVWIGSGAGPERGKRENIGSRMIPYGVAIAVGSIALLIMNSTPH